MDSSFATATVPRLVLQAESAADLMTPDPVSIRDEASIPEAIAWLTDQGRSAAPVVDETGRPVGVLSQSDLLIHERQLMGRAGAAAGGPADPTLVRDIMTPAVFAVSRHYPADKVVAEFLRLHVHQLFVVDADGLLVGVVGTHDVLARLRPEGETASPGTTQGEEGHES